MKEKKIYKELSNIKKNKFCERFIYNYLEENSYIKNIWSWKWITEGSYKITSKGEEFIKDYKNRPLWENWFREHGFLWTIFAAIIWWIFVWIFLYLIS